MAPKDKTELERIATLETEVKYLKYIVFGSIAANIGVQFVHSPVYVIIFTYLAFFASVFLLCVAIFRWRYINLWHRIACMTFSVFVLFSTICRQWIFEPAVEPSPRWYVPALDCIMICVLVIMIIAHWNNNIENIKKGG